MTIRRSLKQLFRMPVTTVLFFILFSIASFFFCCGMSLWANNQATIMAYEDVFTTVGTVRQKATALGKREHWDAKTREYTTVPYPKYSSVIPVSVLDFEGVEYLLEPEKRPYYGAWSHNLNLSSMGSGWSGSFVAELTPLEDCVIDDPVKMQLGKVLWSNYQLREGEIIWICDHFNNNPQQLFADTTYVMSLCSSMGHDDESDVGEYIPQSGIDSSQYAPDGTLIATNSDGNFFQEVTEDFYQTEDGKCWMELAKAMERIYETFPVWPTSGTHLLPSFFNGTAYILEGEDITAEEYEIGERVCLISQKFANNNTLSPGDTVRIPLFYANYKNAPIDNYMSRSMSVPGSFLNAEGKLYPIFSDHEYIIKGIYSSIESSGSSHGMGSNTVVIPAASVKESDADNILAYGPMKDTTTSFQIPNGSIEAFMEVVGQQDVDNLEFVFYDKGYSQLQRGLENMKRMSLFFLVIGAAMAIALIFFFCHLFISKQERRTAIERTLGMSKKKCALSLLSGFLLVVTLAISTGCVAGFFVENKLLDNISTEVYYDTTYTIGRTHQSVAEVEQQEVSVLYPVMAGGGLLIVAILVSAIAMQRNLQKEPLQMLGSHKE